MSSDKATAYGGYYKSKKSMLRTMKQELENERSSFVTQWRDLNDYLLPRRARFFVSDANKGDRRNHKIIHTGPIRAVRTLKSGMQAGAASPARPWFGLTTTDPDLANFSPVKAYLDVVTRRMRSVFSRTNYYNIKPSVYGDLGVFGTSAYSIEEDFEKVFHCNSFPIGSYSIAKDSSGRVNTFFREFRMTVMQLIQAFGKTDGVSGIDWSKFSQQIKTAWDNGNYQTWIDVCHGIYPNAEFDENMLLAKYKKFASCIWETGSDDEDKFLSEKGYDYFPILAPRWETTGEDVYATNCPGMEAIGDIKQLQTGEKRSLTAIEQLVRPSMVAPTAMRSQKTSILPGDVTYADVREGTQGFRKAFEMDWRIDHMENKQQQTELRISKIFFEDLFLTLIESDRRQITAYEIEKKYEEKLLALGPVLEQLNYDDFDPSIDIVFALMDRQGLLPPPPEELQGQNLRVEYESIMAQAQKSIGISSIDRFAGFYTNLLTTNPEVKQKVNADKMLEVYGDSTGIALGIIRPDDEVQMMRQAAAQQAGQQQQAEMALQSTQAVKNLSETPVDGGGSTALDQLIQQAEAGQLIGQ